MSIIINHVTLITSVINVDVTTQKHIIKPSDLQLLGGRFYLEKPCSSHALSPGRRVTAPK